MMISSYSVDFSCLRDTATEHECYCLFNSVLSVPSKPSSDIGSYRCASEIRLSRLGNSRL